MKTLKISKITRNLTLIAAGALMATLVAVPIGSTVSADVLFDEDGDPITLRTQQVDFSGIEFDDEGDPILRIHQPNDSILLDEDGDPVRNVHQPDDSILLDDEGDPVFVSSVQSSSFSGVEFDEDGDPIRTRIQEVNLSGVGFDDEE